MRPDHDPARHAGAGRLGSDRCYPALFGPETVTFAQLYDRALRRVSELDADKADVAVYLCSAQINESRVAAIGLTRAPERLLSPNTGDGRVTM